MLALKAAVGASWLVFSRFLGRLVDFVTLLVLARILAPADFGTTALAMSLLMIVDTVLEIPVTQALSRLPQIDKSHLDTGFTLSFLRGITVAAIILAAAAPFAHFYNDSNIALILMILSLGPLLRGLYSPGMIMLTREMRFQHTFAAEVTAKVFAFFAAMTTLYLGGGYWAIVSNYLAFSIMNTVASYVIFPYWPAASFARYKDFASFIGWFSCSQIVSAISWQFDRVLLGRYVDKPTLGQYALANDLAILPTQSLIGPAMQPIMVAFSKVSADSDRLQQAFSKAARFAMLISVPICIGIALTADLSVALLLGPKWTEAAPMLSILALSIVAVPYFQVLYTASLAINKPIVVFQINAIDLSFRLMLIPLGLFVASIDGVLFARVLLAVILGYVYLAFVKKIIGTQVLAQLANLWKIGAAALAMTAAVIPFTSMTASFELPNILALFATAALGAAVYIGTLFACGLRISIDRNRLIVSDRWW